MKSRATSRPVLQLILIATLSASWAAPGLAAVSEPRLTAFQGAADSVVATNQIQFTDTAGSVFESAIEWLAEQKITLGCNPPGNTRFCPEDPVTRGQMAVFISRALKLSVASDDYFSDDSGQFYEGAANRLFESGITAGCNPPVNDRFCGSNPITREQMAAFLVRAFGLPDNSIDFFIDDQTSQFESAIDRIAGAAVTLGCNPPVNNKFCPGDLVTRGQMAAFFRRALGFVNVAPGNEPLPSDCDDLYTEAQLATFLGEVVPLVEETINPGVSVQCLWLLNRSGLNRIFVSASLGLRDFSVWFAERDTIQAVHENVTEPVSGLPITSIMAGKLFPDGVVDGVVVFCDGTYPDPGGRCLLSTLTMSDSNPPGGRDRLEEVLAISRDVWARHRK